MKTGVEFIACDMPSATPFMLHIYAAVAEEEARAISARTKAGLQAANHARLAAAAVLHAGGSL